MKIRLGMASIFPTSQDTYFTNPILASYVISHSEFIAPVGLKVYLNIVALKFVSRADLHSKNGGT